MLENDRTWKQDYLYRMFSHHTKGKEKENYVVNAIWARLDDLNVKPVTQQYVRRPKGFHHPGVPQSSDALHETNPDWTDPHRLKG